MKSNRPRKTRPGRVQTKWTSSDTGGLVKSVNVVEHEMGTLGYGCSDGPSFVNEGGQSGGKRGREDFESLERPSPPPEQNGDDQTMDADGRGPAKHRRGTTQNDYLRQWEAARPEYGAYVVENDAGPLEASTCASKACAVAAQYRCKTCFGCRWYCVGCMRERHREHIFHRMELWRDGHWRPAALWQLGIKLYLGHGGEPCPKIGEAARPGGRGGGTFQVGGPSGAGGGSWIQSAVSERGPLQDAENLPALIDGIHIYDTVLQGSIAPHTQPSQVAASNAVSTTVGESGDVSREADSASDSPPAMSGKRPILGARPAVVAEADNPLAHPSSDDINHPLQPLTETEALEGEDTSSITSDYVPLIDEDEFEDLEDLEARSLPLQRLRFPRLLPKAPRLDSQCNPFVTVVHTNGIHELPIVYCSCSSQSTAPRLSDAPEAVPISTIEAHFLRLRLFPATFKQASTLFTFDCLELNRLSNLESKVSALNFMQTLRRQTCTPFPESTPDRYHDLLRLSRQWRDMSLRTQFGASQVHSNLPPGSLTLFCPACPQPSVNLPDRWQETFNEKALMRVLTSDGNFKLNHIRQKREDDDVALNAGSGYMTAREDYQRHIRSAEKPSQSETCHAFEAPKDHAGASYNIAGVGLMACRHGCFVPRSGVDFAKGERQVSMDWSLVEGLKGSNTAGLKHVLHVYDVNCQYHVNFAKRVAKAPDLLWDPTLHIVSSIGLFHIFGHKDECLYRYATTYIPGAAIFDGEVAETLWPVMNSVAASTRTATLAHREEGLNDHMLDSNTKKLCKLPQVLIQKHARAQRECERTRVYLQQLSDGIQQELLDKWTEMAEEADDVRFKENNPYVMDILHAQLTEDTVGGGFRAVETSLQEEEAKNVSGIGQTSWLLFGLQLETDQALLRMRKKRLSDSPSEAALSAIARQKQKLRAGIERFYTESDFVVGEGFLRSINVSSRVDIDNEVIPLPSALTDATRDRLKTAMGAVKFNDLVRKERKLRQGQANDALRNLRYALGYLSWQFFQRRRGTLPSGQNHRWTSTAGLSLGAREWRERYNIAFQAMLSLSGKDGVDPYYRFLDEEDCKPSVTFVQVSGPGLRHNRLPWFWMMPELTLRDDQTDSYMEEFYRVHWFRARAEHLRWDEEKYLTRCEMDWVIYFHMHKSREWLDRANGAEMPGVRSYATSQAYMWNEFGRVAEEMFSRAYEFPRIWVDCFAS